MSMVFSEFAQRFAGFGILGQGVVAGKVEGSLAGRGRPGGNAAAAAAYEPGPAAGFGSVAGQAGA